MPTVNLNQLPQVQSFSSIDPNDTGRLITGDSTLTTIAGSGVQYQAASSTTTTTGIWIVGGKKAAAGDVLAAQFYKAFLAAESDTQLHLTSMAANGGLAKAAGALSTKIAALSSTKSSFTRADLESAATDLVSNLGISAAQFINLVFPNESDTATYTTTTFAALTSTADQYANTKLTDNSILQSKFTVASSNRTTCLEGLSNLLKGWTSFLQNLERNI